MDPIAAFKKQQERNTGREYTDAPEQPKSIAELRSQHPRWATIYDRLDLDKTGLLKYDEISHGFHNILGAGSLTPKRHLKKVFDELDTGQRDALDFAQFCSLAKKVTQYMNDHPKWAQEEAAADAEEEKARKAMEREAKKQEGPDIWAALGIAKPKDVAEAEAKKRSAMGHARERRNSRSGSKGSSLAIAGGAMVRNGSQGALVRDSSQGSRVRESSETRGVAAMLRDASLGQYERDSHSRAGSKTHSRRNSNARPPSAGTIFRESWERWSLSTAPTNSTRMLDNRRISQLSEDLPQIRALGRKNAGCFTLRFSPDGSQIAGGFFDGGLRIYSADTVMQEKCLNLPRSKGGTLRSAEEMAHDEKKEREHAEMEALLGARIERAHDPSAMPQEAINVEKMMKDWEPITNLRWQPGGRKEAVIATVDTKGVASLWDVPRSREHRPSKCLSQVETGSSLTALAFTCTGDSVVVAGNDRVLKLFDIESEMSERTLKPAKVCGRGWGLPGEVAGHGLKICGLCGSPTSPHIMFSAGLDRHILMWDLRLAEKAEPVGSIFGIDPAGDALDISRDGNLIFAGSHRTKNPMEMFDVRMIGDDSSEPRVSAFSWISDEHESEGGGRATECLLLSAAWDEFDSKTIVACGEKENLARVYDRSGDPDAPLRVVGTLRGKDSAFWTSAVSSDGRQAAFGAVDGSVCLVDVRRK